MYIYFNKVPAALLNTENSYGLSGTGSIIPERPVPPRDIFFGVIDLDLIIGSGIWTGRGFTIA
jgi:hypothetical protein